MRQYEQYYFLWIKYREKETWKLSFFSRRKAHVLKEYARIVYLDGVGRTSPKFVQMTALDDYQSMVIVCRWRKE